MLNNGIIQNLPKKEYSYTVASVDRAFELLFILEKNKEMGVSELSRMLGVQKSAIHNLLRTMLGHGIVRQTDSGKYALGRRLIRLGVTSSDMLDFRVVANPILNKLANETSLVVLFAIMEQGQLVIVDKVEPQKAFVFVPKFDFGNAFHCTAVGKILLASAPFELQDKLLHKELQKYTPFTNTDAASLIDELRKIKREGYAFACDQMVEGISCIAAPVYDSSGQVVAAVSVTAASSWLNPERYESLNRTIINKTDEISKALGYVCE